MQCILEDVWTILVSQLSFDDVCSCRRVCHDWRSALRECELEVAKVYATTVLQDHMFWIRALQRPLRTSNPLPTWHAEVVRVERLNRAMHGTLRAPHLYSYWRAVDDDA